MATLEVAEFLHVITPGSWVLRALECQQTLLIDHANCERKAASSALSMIYRYDDRRDFGVQFSRIVREEMRHFEQVHALMQDLQIEYVRLSPSKYAQSLHRFTRENNPAQFDDLLIATIIEARSYERFELLQRVLDGKIAKLYRKLQDSEYRHYLTYLNLAEQLESEEAINTRIQELLRYEAKLIVDFDDQFRFHSGDPAIKAS